MGGSVTVRPRQCHPATAYCFFQRVADGAGSLFGRVEGAASILLGTRTASADATGC